MLDVLRIPITKVELRKMPVRSGALARAATMTAVTALFCLALSSDAGAQTVTLEQYRHPKTANDLELNKSYLMGAKDALLALDLSLEEKQFCPPGMPPNVSFEQANTLVLHWVNKTGGATDLSMGRVLLYALKKAYPCSQ